MTAPKRRYPPALLLGAVLLVIAAAAIALGTYALRRADAAIRFHQEEVEAADREGPTRSGSRGPIDGPEEAGSAWDLLTPALEGIWALADPSEEGSLALNSEPNFTAHGAVGDTPVLLERAAPHLEACRRSLRRRIVGGPGRAEARLVGKAGRVCRALCSRGFLAWQDGRDAEAADWLITALSVAQDVARLDPPYANGLLRITEVWVSEEAKFLFSEQGLTESQLREFERRLDVLRATRPIPTAAVWRWGVDARSDVLEGRATVGVPDSPGDPPRNVPLEETVGWRDFWSLRLQKARVLKGLRDAALQSETLPWGSSGDLATAWTSLCARYRPEDVGQLWDRPTHFGIELSAALRLDFLRAAAAVARFGAAHGRMPKDLSETGATVALSRPVMIEGDRIVVDLPTQSLDCWLYETLAPVELNWEIRRR